MATVQTRHGGTGLFSLGAGAARLGLHRLGAVELRRRFWHIAPGFLPLILWFIPHRDPASVTLRTILCGFVAGFGLNAWFRYRTIARPEDGQQVGAVFGYTLSVVLAVLLFPSSPEVGLTVLAILAFGDGSATLGGIVFGGRRLPWNPKKTWSGFVSFLAAGIPLATMIYWGEPHFNVEALPPHLSYGMSLLVVAPAVFLAAVMESLPVRLNDNFRVGGTAALVLGVLHSLVVG